MVVPANVLIMVPLLSGRSGIRALCDRGIGDDARGVQRHIPQGKEGFAKGGEENARSMQQKPHHEPEGPYPDSEARVPTS